MKPLLPSEVALCFLIGGAAIGYLEFLRPGAVAPGVAGMVLLMLGVARVSELPWSPIGVLLLLGGMVSLLLWRGTCWGILLLLLGARYLIGPEELRVRWPVAAGLTIPFGFLTAFLLGIAERARLHKSIL